MPLPVDGLDLLDSLVTGDVLLDDGGGGLGADLGRVGLVGSRQAEGVGRDVGADVEEREKKKRKEEKGKRGWST